MNLPAGSLPAGRLRRPAARSLAALLLGMTVAGCGWHAAYAPRGGLDPVQVLASVDVVLIPGRSGQLLRQALQTRLEGAEGAGAPDYRLTTRYSVTQDALGITPNSSVTRTRVTATANYVLSTATGGARTCASGNVRQVDGFDDINGQFFASDLETATVQRRLAEAVADEITARLVLVLGHTDSQGRASPCEG